MKPTAKLVCCILLVAFTGLFQSVFAQNKVDENGKKQGPWERKYRNGKTKYKGQFKDDVPVGDFVYYDIGGKKTAELSYLESGKAEAKLFHDNGRLAGEGVYINKKKEGLWKLYSERGFLSGEENYRDGKKEGENKVFYENGQLSRETTYSNGLESGIRKEFYATGHPSFIGNVVDGNFDGEVQFFHDNGKIKMKGSYNSAVRDGKWTWYDDRGIPEKVAMYTLGTITEILYEKNEN